MTRQSIAPTAVLTIIFVLASKPLFAADPPPPGTDVLVFSNGDQLTGKLVGSAAGKVTFHSDMAGDVTVDFEKVKEIRSPQKFAVIQNGV
jgi:hypothetical protein